MYLQASFASKAVFQKLFPTTAVPAYQLQVHAVAKPCCRCRDYKDIIRHCFMEDGHLRFELRKPEAQNLCR